MIYIDLSFDSFTRLKAISFHNKEENGSPKIEDYLQSKV